MSQSVRTPAGPSIRFAAVEDADGIAQLCCQLGYPSTVAETAQRLMEVIGVAEHAVFVAEADGTVVGWLHVFVSHTLLADASAEISGLVIDEQHRSRGLGRVLMAHAEQWARSRGCRSVRLRSNVVRSRAHAFYESLGYDVIKTQKAFCRNLPA